MEVLNKDFNINLTEIDAIVDKIGRTSSDTIPILQAIQEQYRYLPAEALQRVCEITEITPAQIVGVSSFYSQFRHHPVGRHIISVCHGTACHVKRASTIDDALRDHLNLSENEDTDTDRLFTLQKVACLGCCTLAPVVQIDGVTYGHLTSEMVPRVLRDFLALQKRTTIQRRKEHVVDKQNGYTEIRVGLGSCCIAGGSANVYDAIQQALIEINAKAMVKRVGCVGMCHQTPLVEIVPQNGRSALYARVLPEDAKSIVLRHFTPRGITQKFNQAVLKILENVLRDEVWMPVTRYSIEVRDPHVAAFLGRQMHIATEHRGHLNPTDLDEYCKHDGFKALNRCVNECAPEQIINEIQNSGLRGRGGAGFPSGLKWATVRKASDASGIKYIICNGDEGDPGAFMDRMLLESYPYRIIEGMIIAAFAVGAQEGYFYIRAEYPLAVKRVREALKLCEDRGFLGENILGSGFNLRLRIMEGAGAFVCGEETALLASIEGKRGMPRLRPPFPAEEGLWGRPTLVNNVETYALVPWIVRNGATAFAELGSEKSKGTKVFSLAGKINRGGLIEVPMGMTIREIVEEIGGGIAGGKRFKAVQIGGPSGGCVPAELADTPVDYEALSSVGAIMGSGGLVVLDESDCMVDMARYFLEFTQDQSCGKCTYCRIGTRRMLDVLLRICEDRGKTGDLEELEQLARMVGKGSICGLGKTAPNPILSTLKYFRHEYEAHIEGTCPAGKCRELITYSINENCTGCTKCAQNCAAGAIKMRPYEIHEIDMSLCTRCDICRQVCPEEAVEVF